MHKNAVHINIKIKTDSKIESLWVNIKEGVTIGSNKFLVYWPVNSTKEINSSLWQEINRADKQLQIGMQGRKR